MSSAILTYTRKSFDPLHPDPALIDPVDIAHALSLLCRAGGHFKTFYSVGQHCLNCQKEAAARALSPRVQLILLLHDAGEAYLSDITRPVKACLPDYLIIEKALQAAIYLKFLNTPPTEDELSYMKTIDDTLLHHEFFHINGETVFSPPPPLFADCRFDFVDFQAVERAYLTTLQTLLEALS